MKTLKSILVALVSILIFEAPLSSQTVEIYGLMRNDPNGAEYYVVKYNTSTQYFDNLLQLPVGIHDDMGHFSSTIDPFNHKYYFSTNYGQMWSYDMVTEQLIRTIGGYNCLSQQYDQFLNALIYQDSLNRLNVYYLDSAYSDVVVQLPASNHCTGSQVVAYNPIQGHYFYCRSNGDYPEDTLKWTVVDVPSKRIIVNAAVPDSMAFNSLVYSTQTNKYYGFVGTSYSKALYEIDPFTLSRVKLVNLPTDYYANLNQQNGMYDPVGNRYFLPYYSINSENNLAVFDLNTNSIAQILPFPHQPNLNQLQYKPLSTNLIFRNNKLIATKGESYQWYLNDNWIQNSLTNSLTPVETGNYKVVVMIGDSSYASNSVYFNPTGINEDAHSHVSLHPNPAHQELVVQLNRDIPHGANFTMYDLLGKRILTLTDVQEKTFRIDISTIDKGFYLYRLLTDGIEVDAGKIIVR